MGGTKKLDERILFAILTVLYVFFFILDYNTKSTFDPGDGIRHYLVSRYSWKHPGQFFYSWGKPFFTLVSSPFSQFGIMGIYIFNILCGMFSSFFAFRIAQKMKFQFPWLAAVFTCFATIYFPTMNSGLTEPLFGLVLITSIFLVTEENFFLAAILISFLAFVRTEGNLALPLFFIVYLFRKKYWQILFLPFGTIAYSIAGYFYYHDIFWIKTQNPYTNMNADIYGKGPLMHFVNQYNEILGVPLAVLFVTGMLVIATELFTGKIKWPNNNGKNYQLEYLFLVVGSFCAYFIAHSIFWWKGIVGSLGLIRVMAGVIPVAALVSLKGANYIFERLDLYGFKTLKKIFLAAVIFAVMYWPFRQYYFPFKLDPESQLIYETGSWYHTTEYKKHKVYYLFPYLAHMLDVDPFDDQKVGELWGLYPTIRAYGIDAVPDSTIIIWDGHFGPNEARIPLDTIMNDKNFQLIKKFSPENEFTTLGGYQFEVYVFMKIKPVFSEELKEEFYDLEDVTRLRNTNTITSEKKYSGQNSCKLSPQNEFGVMVLKNTNEIRNRKEIGQVDIKFRMFSETSLDNVFFVMSTNTIAAPGKDITWLSREIACPKSNWNLHEVKFPLSPETLHPDQQWKLYIWNKAKKTFYVDDIQISYSKNIE